MSVNELRNKVISYVRMNGPILPVQIAKSTGVDILFSGALLSELVANKIIKISHAKIGSSPVYYAPGQEPKLNMLYKNLPEKERQAYDLLKEKKMVFDRDVEPAIRVALRFIKDFSIPLTIMRNNQQETAWKWYLSSDEEITKMLAPKPLDIPQPTLQPNEELLQPIRETKELQQQLEPKPEAQKEVMKLKKPRQKQPLEDLFLQQVYDYLNKTKIRVIATDSIKKNKEANLIIAVPSHLGEIEFLLAAKNKKKMSEADVSLAHHQGQIKKLPVILLSPGEMAKKAELYRERNLKGYLIFKKL